MSKVNSVKVMVGLKGSSYTNQFLVLGTLTLNHFWSVQSLTPDYNFKKL